MGVGREPRTVGKNSALAWCVTINTLEEYRADKGSRGAGGGEGHSPWTREGQGVTGAKTLRR